MDTSSGGGTKIPTSDSTTRNTAVGAVVLVGLLAGLAGMAGLLAQAIGYAISEWRQLFGV